jgi:hypothetical protein
MELDDCITKDCSTIYRFQFASIAFICGVYLPFTFHANIWSLYTQAFTPVNCTTMKASSSSNLPANLTFDSLSILSNRQFNNRSDCCGCQTMINSGNIHDKRFYAICQEWFDNIHEFDVRKATILDEVS